jgi:5-oxoprolinase (ATP-hydrolysing)
MKWKFFIDKGGTFTDIVAVSPEGKTIVHKVLSTYEDQTDDSTLSGIKEILKSEGDQNTNIEVLKIGTTLGTNTLLQRKGPRIALLTTEGFEDSIYIGYQNRPKIFELYPHRRPPLYHKVIGVQERISTGGDILIAINKKKIIKALEILKNQGFSSLVISFLHALKNDTHEKTVFHLAKKIGFKEITCSHQFPVPKYILRTETAILDSYLNPVIKSYSDKIDKEHSDSPLFFMQSSGGLVKSNLFRGSDSLLSGPAGGVIGAIKAAEACHLEKIIGFDMGGTSTDVFHYSGELERKNEHIIADIKLSASMLDIHTLAAGGGSILKFQDERFQVGPLSAGSNPGPSCYDNDGPLTITDANLLLGRILPSSFAKTFGKDKKSPLNPSKTYQNFTLLQKKTCPQKSLYEMAEGFINIANQKMALGLEKISKQRGIDLKNHTLVSYGGAGGQHACELADILGLKKVFIHPLSSVLSACGIGKAQIRNIQKKNISFGFSQEWKKDIEKFYLVLEKKARDILLTQGVVPSQIKIKRKIELKYKGTFSLLSFDYCKDKDFEILFSKKHLKEFGHFKKNHGLWIESISVEALEKENGDFILQQETTFLNQPPKRIMEKNHKIFYRGEWHPCPLMTLDNFEPTQYYDGPCLLIGGSTSIFIPPKWKLQRGQTSEFIIHKELLPKFKNGNQLKETSSKADPILIELFNNRFLSIAEQMGLILEKTSMSVNIKERLDFSCAIFDRNGNLLSNAPHIPVHLGSMEDSVKSIIKTFEKEMIPGDSFLQNDPYNGGTHLPDITVISPLFYKKSKTPLFFVASRGHHADIGGITPGSMPSESHHIDEEGVLIQGVKIVSKDHFMEKKIHKLFLKDPKFPTREFGLNLADIKAKIAANHLGIQKLSEFIDQYDKDLVLKYADFLQENACHAVEELIQTLKSGHFTCPMDNGSLIKVNIIPHKKIKRLTIDFSGTSKMSPDNFNTPFAVTKAAILYVLRVLLKKDIPLNSGCLKPVDIMIPPDGLLSPKHPHAVVAGNVETSQILVDALFGALGVLAASQGTMNNFTFGNDDFQYYETICGGAGAGENAKGEDAIHTHMTNSRITDPEVLEDKFPILLEEFSIRKGSGGEGKFKGGNGVKRTFKFLKKMEVSLLTGRRKYPPHGLFEGANGLPGKNLLTKKNGNKIQIPSTATLTVYPEDRLMIETPGGGGFLIPENQN